ncbi:hypothetical protein CR513_34682, partial [Mucuna pruriens]
MKRTRYADSKRYCMDLNSFLKHGLEDLLKRYNHYRKYVLDLLKEIEKLGCKTLGVPIEQNHMIGCEESSTIDKSQYQRLVGKLIYLSHTRLDIACVFSMVNQFMHDPKERHL